MREMRDGAGRKRRKETESEERQMKRISMTSRQTGTATDRWRETDKTHTKKKAGQRSTTTRGNGNGKKTLKLAYLTKALAHPATVCNDDNANLAAAASAHVQWPCPPVTTSGSRGTP